MSRFGALPALCLVTLLAAGARAEEPAGPPPNYVAGFLGTTMAYRPPGGPFEGHQRDLTPLLGYGRYVSRTLALELDLGPTFLASEYSSFSLVPGVVWSFHPNAYAAARFIIPLDPQWNLGLSPGFGVIHTFKNGLSPLLEANVVSYVARGDADLALSLTAGVLFSF